MYLLVNGEQMALHAVQHTYFADVIKSYNPDLVGYSEGWGPVWWEPSSHLNVAKPGAKAK